MMADASVPEGQYWFVGSYYSDRDPQDQTDRFVTEGIWENGFEDRYLETVKSMKVGDQIAIKSTYVRKDGLPFDPRGHAVPVLSIKAIGVVTANPGDGRRVEVDWTRLKKPREWYFYTGRHTIWKVTPSHWMREALIRFAFWKEPQDVDRFRNDPAWAKRFADADPKPEQRFEWTAFYEEMATALLAYRTRRPELLGHLRDMQDRHEELGFLVDRDRRDNPMPLRDICPFTVMGTFNRGATPEKRTEIATGWAELLGVRTPAPTSFDGIPLLNNQNSWFFPTAATRHKDDIDTLWDVFECALAAADSSEDHERLRFADAYSRARDIYRVGTKLTMGLFWIRPWNFVPLDGRSRQYLKTELMLDQDFFAADGIAYVQLLDTLASKFEDPQFAVHSFPELSWTAYLERDGRGAHAEAAEAPEVEDDDPTPISPQASYTVHDIVTDGCFIPEPALNSYLARWRSKKNLILQGPPGTGKTWLARRLAYALIGTKDNKSALRATQFHPNSSYEDFVRGWRPGSDGKLTLVDGPFLEMVERANANPDVPHVMLIEEINRGNPVQVFGELLTLIEAGKRSPRESLQLAYPRSGSESVHVPSNLYIIGTMNLADRSLAIMDLAFRRRFAFVSLEPNVNDAWQAWMSNRHNVPPEHLELVRTRFQALNERIAEDPALGGEFRLGHSFVTPPAEERVTSFPDWFRGVVDTEIVPTLEEYWFDDPAKAAAATEALTEGLV
ncbi:McrB family protein [Sinomonas susongensis]|uniref:McrB family protein n=1 Tax=Sinomonas susongensis TaxID=1324851 RepID=UPI001BB0DD61|nr:AAA family ATPase [Sinomonas susongensis]